MLVSIRHANSSTIANVSHLSEVRALRGLPGDFLLIAKPVTHPDIFHPITISIFYTEWSHSNITWTGPEKFHVAYSPVLNDF